MYFLENFLRYNEGAVFGLFTFLAAIFLIILLMFYIGREWNFEFPIFKILKWYMIMSSVVVIAFFIIAMMSQRHKYIPKNKTPESRIEQSINKKIE